MIQLRAMTEAEFARFRILDRENYSRSLTYAHGMSIEEARLEALTQGEEILKDGIRTPGHEFLTAVDGATGAVAGYLWYEVNRLKRRAFLYFIVVEDAERGKGAGRAAMEALEERLRSEGIKSLGLHVFSHNTVALHLYESRGFRTTGLNMEKDL
jgi:ribosomal protein S18 acetylase RimI-like enzyme